MAGEAGKTTSGLTYEQQLVELAQQMDFFQVLRRLEAIHPELPGFGRSARPSEDPIRFGQEPGMEFAPTMIKSFEPASEQRPAKLNSYFFGLFGPNGPLPLHLTEYVQQRKQNAHDPTFADFVDLFHHRMFSLLYRAWASSRPTIAMDSPDRDKFRTYIGSLVGLGMPSLWDRDALPDHAKLHFAGIMAMQNRPAEGLQVMLEQFFLLPVRIVQFLGGWMPLPQSSRLRLGESEATGQLGQTAVIGASVWNCQHRVRILIGPMSLQSFCRLLPGQESVRRLVALVRSYLGDEFDWDLQLVLDRHQVPSVSLGSWGQLGWTSWLCSEERTHDADDVVLNLSPSSFAYDCLNEERSSNG